MTDRQLAAMSRRAHEEWSRAYDQTKTEDFENFRSPLMAAIEKVISEIDLEQRRRNGEEERNAS